MFDLPELPDDEPLGRRPDDLGALQADVAHWSQLVAGDDLARTLARLDADAQVALERRTRERMRAAAVMLDLDRLLLAAAARLIYHAQEYRGAQPLAAWVEALIDRAIEDLLDEDAIEERDERDIAHDDPRYAHLAAQLLVDARTFRRGSVVFHRMPNEERAAFWAVFVDRKSIERHAVEARISLPIARRRLDRAVTTFCTLGQRRDSDPGSDPRQRQGGSR